MFKICHQTLFANLESILCTSDLVISSSRIPRQFNQGQPARKLSSDPRASLLDSKFYEKYDEVDGVYMHLDYADSPIPVENEVTIVFYRNVVYENRNVINTEENYGFMIDESGYENVSQFSGEMGVSFMNFKNLNMLRNYDFNPKRSEIVLLDNIHISYIKHIYINNKNNVDLKPIKKLIERLDFPVSATFM